MVRQAKDGLRKTDVVARLGGDEFVLLLPETDQDAARMVISKIQRNLRNGMQENHSPVTFSIGVLTCQNPPGSPDEVIRIADDLMYSVKRGGKNAIKYAVCGR